MYRYGTRTLYIRTVLHVHLALPLHGSPAHNSYLVLTLGDLHVGLAHLAVNTYTCEYRYAMAR